jgi:hypothetical protein
VVCHAHLVVLSIEAQGRFGARGSSHGEKWCQLFSVQRGVGKFSMGYGFRMSQNLTLADALFPLDGGRRREGKKLP